MEYILGIDIGGTNTVIGAVAADGSVLHGLRAEPTQAEAGPDQVIDRILQHSRQVLSTLREGAPEATILGVGIGSPGPLDTTTGTVLVTPNLGWVDMPLRQRIADGLQLTATLDNDANCAILGEWWQGAAQGTQYAVGLTLGTGIGGGIILNGQLLHGASDCAGEVGHITIDAQGRRCACGNDGCVEAYASGPAIARRAREALASGAISSLRELVESDPGAISAQAVYQAATEGDQLAVEVVRDTAKYLGAAVANLINIFNPEIVVLCGGVTQAGDGLLQPLRREVAQRAFKPAVAACRIVPGTLGHAAGVYGAAASFQQLAPERVSHPIPSIGREYDA